MSGRERVLTVGKGILAALVLFFLAESAAARRVGLDLFLPVAGGTLLPWRTARFALITVLTVLTALRGGNLLQKLDRACDRDGARWALSAAVTALFFLWAARVTVLSYFISDDITTLKAIAAIPTQGYDLAARTFSSDLFCAFLGLFYRLDPDGYWYFYYEAGMQLISLMILGRCILLRVRRRGWRASAGCLIHAALCAGLFLYPFAAMTFTLTAAMAGTAAVALVLCRDAAVTRAGQAASDVGSGLLMLLCFLQRSGSGKALLCFWALAVAYQILKSFLCRERQRAGALLAAAAVTAGAIFLCGRVSLADVEPEYQSGESIRSLIVDYLIDELGPEDFEAAGFSPELAALTRDWFFMDRRVTAESFWQLAQAYYADESPADPAAGRLAGLVSSLAGHIASDGQMSTAAWSAAVLLILTAAVFLRAGKAAWPECLTAVCAAGGAFLLSLYLLGRGYFPARAFLVVMYPAVVTMTLALLAAPRTPEGISFVRLQASGWTCRIMAAALAGLCVLGICRTPHVTEAFTREDLFSDQWKIEAYAREHPDTTFINNAYFAVFDPLHSADYPDNLLWWGNCGDLTRAPADRLYADAFFRDDVLFLGDGLSTLLFLLQYLTAEYGPVQATLVTQISRDLFITDIDLVSPEDSNYTGWYKQNGMTYYFEKGHAVTGTKTVGGISYAFAPAGTRARLAAAAEDGTVYTTDAYSLVS